MSVREVKQHKAFWKPFKLQCKDTVRSVGLSLGKGTAKIFPSSLVKAHRPKGHKGICSEVPKPAQRTSREISWIMKTRCLSWHCTAAVELSQPQWPSLHLCLWLGGNFCPNRGIFVWTGIFPMSCSLNAVWSWRFAQFPLEYQCKYRQDVYMCPAASSAPFPNLPKQSKERGKII